MSTYGDMQGRIRDEMIDEALTLDQIKKAILTSIRHYERRKFWFNRASQDIAIAPETETYSLSADGRKIIEIETAKVSFGGGKTNIRIVADDVVEDEQGGLVTGDPHTVAVQGGLLRVYPIPTRAGTVTALCHYRFAELTSDADNNSWTNECEELIRNAAKRRLAKDILRDDAMSASFETEELKALDALLMETRTTRSVQVLRTPPMLQQNGFDINMGDY